MCAEPPPEAVSPVLPASVAALSAAAGLQQLAAQHRPALPTPSRLLSWNDTLSFYQTLLAGKASAAAQQEPAALPADDQPLDLSCSRQSPPAATNSRPARKQEAPPSNKKPYTEEELQAALRDIQSGRLGTRRAAVIYGIPRSTLRNKVYRLAAQEKRAELAADAKAAPEPEPEPEPPAAEPEPEPEPGPPCQLLQARLTQPVEPASQPIRAVMSWMCSSVLQRALQTREPDGPRADQPPVWDDFVRRMSHERVHEVLAQLRAAVADPPAPIPSPSAELSDSKSSDDVACQQSPSPAPAPAARKRKLELTENNNNTVVAAPPAKTAKPSTKGSRPKRGKYRNYNRSHLAEAVRAVQSGEMSVHRAGNFYGVPHSTLEYKVKQRHLDRAGRRERAADLSISDITNRAHTAGGQVLQTTESS
ncbi:mblk-1-related factor 1-like [Pollicipes pollicipes]|uniref:mblk-1-related factor 1-like n=1 Tax=Pollicipes pollicipes TaxID=41117 RepID=UPI00188575F7|nr:mblk-1-related factor 1-like [Pollicipes pollicipes]